MIGSDDKSKVFKAQKLSLLASDLCCQAEVNGNVEDGLCDLGRRLDLHELSFEVEAAALRESEVEQNFSVHLEKIGFEGELKFSPVDSRDRDRAVVVDLPREGEAVKHRRQSLYGVLAFRGHEETRHSLHQPLVWIRVHV